MATENKSSATQLANYIAGKFVKPTEDKYIDDFNPATNEVIALIPDSCDADVENAVNAALPAQKKWAALSYKVRAAALYRIADIIESKLQELAELESQDSGKPVSLALKVDIPRAVSNFRFFAGAILHDETQCTHMDDAVNYTHRSPVGVCGLITPWNLPLYLLTWKVAPSLAMGNAVICKPSEITPRTAFALAEIIHSIPEIPAGTFNMVHGYGARAGAAIVAHPRINLISFTGGTVTGRKVASAAAAQFKKISLELGGKNSTVVFADCDFNATVAGAVRAAFANQGQVCLSGSRLFIEKSVYDKFMTAFVEKAKELGSQLGDPKTSGFGALSSLAHRDKVASYVEWARKNGGTIHCGGELPKLDPPFDAGAFYPPTVISGLSYDSKCSMEEIFGPVVTVHQFESEEDVLKMVNSVEYGLAGSVWTSNLSRGHRIAQRIESGMIWVNCWLHRDLRVPFGGVKNSGLGREGGVHSLEFYSEAKNICIKYA